MTNEQKIFTAPAILTRISFTKDGGLTLGFSTNELTAEEKISISKFHGGFGWLGFKENHIDLADMPKEEAEDKNKTPAKRLRASIYVLGQQRGISKEKSETFYREQMEKLIEFVKNKLD